MAHQEVANRILEALESAAEQEGLDIVSVEVGGPAAHPVVSVRIDSLAGESIDMQKVCAATPWVSEIVERLDPFPGAYELEVSSPGLDRPLRRERDFVRFAGETAEVALVEKIDGRNKACGTIVGAADGMITLLVDGAEWCAPLAKMKSAHIKPDYAKIFAAAKEAQPDGTLLAGGGAGGADEDDELAEDDEA